MRKYGIYVLDYQFSKCFRSLEQFTYRISSYSFRGNYSFLNLTLCTVTFGNSTYRCGYYSREETIQGRKLYEEIRYISRISFLKLFCRKYFLLPGMERGSHPNFLFFVLCHGRIDQHGKLQQIKEQLPF